MISLKLIDKDANKVCFALKGINAVFANTLRRNILERVPTMAIEEVEFSKNSSILYDEIIAHRLGLVPLTTDLETYNLPRNCSCDGKGCAKCRVKLTLSSKGPCTVYCSELKSKDPKIKPVYPEMPIVKLLKGQLLELEATAVLGEGKEHAKWVPGYVHYRYYPVIDIDDKKLSNPEECAKVCPVDVFEVKNNKLAIKNLLNCTLCGACAEAASNSAIKLNESEDNVLFFVESFGQLDCKEILVKATEVFDELLDSFNKELKKLK